MSTLPPPPPPPPEPRTEPLLAPGAVPAGQRVVAPVVEPAAVALPLEGAIASLRTGLALVAVLALAALAVAVYALLSYDNTSTHGRYASSARVSEISRRVDRLNAQQQNARAGAPAAPAVAPSSGTGDTAALGARVDALERTVRTLAARPAPPDSTQALAQLSSRIDTLSTQVAQLKQAPAPAAP